MKLRNMASIYIFNDEKVLMMYRVGSRVFKGALWAGIGGHFENDELNDPTKCVLRELFEETGIKEVDIENLKLKYITTRRAEDEIRQQYIFTANLSNKAVTIIPCDEGETSWVSVSDVLIRKMSFTNGECLKHYFSIGKNDNELYSGVVNVLENKPAMAFIPLRSFSTTY
jgi:ADP-ribose pyrophosphatase